MEIIKSFKGFFSFNILNNFKQDTSVWDTMQTVIKLKLLLLFPFFLLLPPRPPKKKRGKTVQSNKKL